jgi:hypothetical protein
VISQVIKQFFLVCLVLGFSSKLVYADYRAQCLGPDGKFLRCYLHVNLNNLVIRYKLPGPTVEIPGGSIFRIVYQHLAEKNHEESLDPLLLTSLYKNSLSTTFLTNYASLDENTVLGIQFTDQQQGRHALMMRLRDDEGRGLQMQLESISKLEAVPMR